MQIISIATMRELERRTIESGVSGYELMRRAGRGAAEEICKYMHGKDFSRVVVLVGHGNNGGDALIVAGLLNIPTKVYATTELTTLRHEAACAAQDLPNKVEVEVRDTLSLSDFRPGDLIVDGLLGIGFGGELRPQLRNWIAVANDSNCPIVAIDLPSGINGDTGNADSGIAIQAELTVTFGYPKCGHFNADGPAYSGRLRLVDIGLNAPDLSVESTAEACFAVDAAKLLKRPEFDTYKNRRGRLLIVGGSANYSGAATLLSWAALRAGAGIVRLATPVKPFAPLPGALIARVVKNHHGVFDLDSLPELETFMAQSDAIVAGSGWDFGTEIIDILSKLLEFSGPVLLDADALNAVAREPKRWVKREKLIITPHLGEAKRLAEAFDIPLFEGRSEFALAIAARLNAVTVLKGPHTVVAAPDGRCCINSSGCPALATAGSGDVLGGIIGALLSGNPDFPYEMAKLGVFLHGLAGELGDSGLIADDLPRLAALAAAQIRRG
ncbi:MAG: NAD(P)H-hydrate dehydratase [Victivallales bacterium]|jgi:NAD(P)H-hydrate epimerase|nr:NAD(P)H-hydrate dehydratase [Victivallales bacterium]